MTGVQTCALPIYSMRLLKLCPEVQEMLIDDIISSGHARALIPIEDVELQKKIANEVMDKSLSVRETETLVRKLLSDDPEKEKSKEKQKDKKTELLYKSLEDKIKSIMGTKVSIQKKSKNKGKIEIEYYSDEDLNRIYDLLMSIQK